MRSTDKGCDGGGIRTMRYPCEYKFPGGNMEEGESAEATALRELSEELLVPCGIALPPQDQVQLIPLAVKYVGMTDTDLIEGTGVGFQSTSSASALSLSFYTAVFATSGYADVRAFLRCGRQTRPIRGRSNLIFNFVLLADENPWLGPLLEDTATINGHLASRR